MTTKYKSNPADLIEANSIILTRMGNEYITIDNLDTFDLSQGLPAERTDGVYTFVQQDFKFDLIIYINNYSRIGYTILDNQIDLNLFQFLSIETSFTFATKVLEIDFLVDYDSHISDYTDTHLNLLSDTFVDGKFVHPSTVDNDIEDEKLNISHTSDLLALFSTEDNFKYGSEFLRNGKVYELFIPDIVSGTDNIQFFTREDQLVITMIDGTTVTSLILNDGAWEPYSNYTAPSTIKLATPNLAYYDSTIRNYLTSIESVIDSNLEPIINNYIVDDELFLINKDESGLDSILSLQLKSFISDLIVDESQLIEIVAFQSQILIYKDSEGTVFAANQYSEAEITSEFVVLNNKCVIFKNGVNWRLLVLAETPYKETFIVTTDLDQLLGEEFYRLLNTEKNIPWTLLMYGYRSLIFTKSGTTLTLR